MSLHLDIHDQNRFFFFAWACFFAAMAVCVKVAAAWFNAAELVFYRGLLGMLFMWLMARQQRVTLATASVSAQAAVKSRFSARQIL